MGQEVEIMNAIEEHIDCLEAIISHICGEIRPIGKTLDDYISVEELVRK